MEEEVASLREALQQAQASLRAEQIEVRGFSVAWHQKCVSAGRG